ncbi:MAG: hypothetical protein JW384_02178 [Nitrosomonadaceae bacterium]|nr:hypothetical protein [Nitrosomonadaceae bacterium]
MAINGKDGSDRCPDTIAVIGGGRWARVLTEVLCGLVSPSVRISVHSRHNAELMAAWVSEREFRQQVHVSSDWPKFLPVESSAVLVVNAARDHERAVEMALSIGVPVLVEKPITLSAAATQRLADLARSRNVHFAAAHIFLFARYLDRFSRLVADAGGARCMRIEWTDPKIESRYGERKQYNAGLPIYLDWLPHVLSIASTLAPSFPQKCEKLELLKGGAHLALELVLGDVPCSVKLIRNADRRQRRIEVVTRRKTLQLDFSSEPGTITADSTTINGDPDWDVKRRPAARMLGAFLQWAAGGAFDSRLDVEIGLKANQVIDQVAGMYREAMMTWLITRLAFLGPMDDDLHYALSEILQSEASFPEVAVDRQIERVLQQFSERTATSWLKELNEAQDPSMFFRSLAL